MWQRMQIALLVSCLELSLSRSKEVARLSTIKLKQDQRGDLVVIDKGRILEI